ncbi:MAG: HIT family protein [Candidatus Poseidoniaceae archaeon]|nr:HIT family protein [Candidatus Poseidoniaceae archaeon]
MDGAPTLFSLIIKGEIPASFVAKGEDWVAFLDINPRREGHTLVVPHQQGQRLSDLTKPQLSSLMGGVVEVQKRLGQHFDTSDFSIVVHDGPDAGQEIPHVHIHVIPRTEQDGGRSILSMWPNAPPIGSTEPDYIALSELAAELSRGE